MGLGSPMTVLGYSSHDGGLSWSAPATLWSGRAYVGRPYSDLGAKGRWAVAQGASLRLSPDFGASWREVVLPFADGSVAGSLQFATAADAFIISEHSGTCPCQRLWRSTDAGQTWAPMS